MPWCTACMIIKLLLVHGADPSIKNNSGNTPVDESSPEIKQIFEDYKHNPMSVIMSTLTMTGLVEDGVRLISYNGEVIAREVIRNKKLLRKSTRYQWERICQQWKLAFHGTRFDCIESILEHGSLKSGSKTPLGEQIKPPSNHIQLGKKAQRSQGQRIRQIIRQHFWKSRILLRVTQ